MLSATLRNSQAINAIQLLRRSKALLVTEQPKLILRYAFYAFLFSLPFEMAEMSVGGILTLSKFLGYIVALLAVTQYHVCFRLPPKAFWLFAAYVMIVAVAGVLLILEFPDQYELPGMLRTKVFSFGQKVVLFWISANLLLSERTAKGALYSLAASAVILATLSALGFTAEVSEGGRLAAFDANPNSLATVLSIGLLAAIGLGYGRANIDFKSKLFCWLCSGFLALAIVRTGSRGAVVALVGSFMVFVLKMGGLGVKIKVALIALLAVGALAFASYEIEPVRARWEKTIYEGNLAGRQTIYWEAWTMFTEKPLFGWGPMNHFHELGLRVGAPSRDPHNLYLWLLTEVGLLGAIPFLIGLLLCARAAWLARHGAQGILPLAMVVFIGIINMKGSWHNSKLFWVALAYTVAGSGYAALRRRQRSPAAARPALRPRRSYSPSPRAAKTPAASLSDIRRPDA